MKTTIETYHVVVCLGQFQEGGVPWRRDMESIDCVHSVVELHRVSVWGAIVVLRPSSPDSRLCESFAEHLQLKSNQSIDAGGNNIAHPKRRRRCYAKDASKGYN